MDQELAKIILPDKSFYIKLYS